MPTALADPPAAPTEQQPSAGSPTPGHEAQPEPRPVARSCAECGAPLADGQDWCLQCGTGAPDSLRARTPTWRSAAVVLGTLAVLVAGAAGAAYAALSKGSAKPRPGATTVAQVTAPASAAPPATASTPLPPTASVPATTPKIGIPTTIKPSTAPKIPLSVPTPKPSVTPVPKITPSIGGVSPTGKKKSSNTSTPVGEANAEALLLDTNAASTYNPYNYAATNFGDPSLAIDGDSTTGWTALVEPSVAPKLAEGLLIDLNTPRKLAAVGLSTSTPGMTVQIYGADGTAPPGSITDPAWAALTPALHAKKKHARIKLGGAGPVQQAAKQAHRFIVVWVSEAPASAVGTPQAPGHVAIDELELFPRKKK